MSDFTLTEDNLNTPNGVLSAQLTLRTVIKEYGICCFYVTKDGNLVVAHPDSLTIDAEHEKLIATQDLEIFKQAKNEFLDEKITELLAKGKTEEEIVEILDVLSNM